VSKRAAQTQAEICESGSSEEEKSPRQALAEAIRIRDEAAAEEKTLADAKARAREDGFKARRAVEDCQRSLASAQQARACQLVTAYVGNEESDDSEVNQVSENVTRMGIFKSVAT